MTLKRGETALRASLGLVAAVLVNTSALLGAEEAFRTLETNAMMGEAAPAGAIEPTRMAERAGQGIDWRTLLAVNGEVVGWLEVEDVGISYPIVKPSDALDGDWYLGHDLWGSPSYAGWPYADSRSTARHLLLYGHHVRGSDSMFSPIAGAWEQERFDGVGKARWITPDGGARSFTPLCAFHVDQDFADIQRFEWQDGGFKTWLEHLVGQARAHAPDEEALIARATQALTLATCSSERGGQRERALVLFVDE